MGEDEDEITCENLFNAKFKIFIAKLNSLKITNDGQIFLDIFHENFPQRIETVQNFVEDQKKVYYKIYHLNFLDIKSHPLNKDTREIFVKHGNKIGEYIHFMHLIYKKDSLCLKMDYIGDKYDIIINFLKDMEFIE